METANLPSVVSLGLKQAAQLDQCKNFVPTSYTVDVGQSLFTKPLKPENLDQIQTHSVKLEDTEFDYDIEYSTDHVPLGEILDRLQNEDRYETNDKSNLIRLHAANDSNAATISATLNFATLDLSSQSSLQSHLSEINDVLFSINKPDPSLPLAISTNSPPSVPDNVNSIFCASPSPASSSDQETPLGKNTSGLLNVLSAQSPPGPSQQPSSVSFGTSSESNKTSPQECNLCNKMFGNASALAKHRLTHSDERKYLCTVCHKAFKRQDHLNGHLLTHRNKKPFECTAQGCNKSYCDARSLRRHRENHHSSKEDKLVSPASSITSSDLDEKSLGSESCDGSIKGTKLVFTGINCLEKEKLTKITTDTQQFQLIEQILRESKECQEAPPAIQVKTPTTPGPSPRPRPRAQFQSQHVMSHQQRTNVTTKSTDSDLNQNMVECSICSRKFKNIPALNGHMRLHGGYYRKDNDKNKQQQHHQHQSDNSHKVIVSSEPVSTHRVSSNVISLIEEKIIQKRKLEPSSSSTGRLATVTGYISSQTPQHQHPSSLMSPTQKFTFLTSSSPSSSASCSITSVLCSTSTSVTPTTTIVEPPHKRLALESNHKTISSLDNLVFPVLPQPDTDKLLANLQAKQPSPPLSHHMTTLNTFLPDSPHLPNVPLPDKRCGSSSIVTTASLANSRLQLQLSSPVNTSIIKDTSSITPVKSAHQQKLLKIQRTDFQPSIGDDFQAVLPEVISSRAEDVKYGLTPLDTLMWSPDLDSELSEPQLEAYLKLASSSAVKDNGNNVENALYTLLLCNGSISRASQRLLGFMKLEDDLYSSSALSSPSMMSSPVKSSSRDWTAEEVDMFYEALCKHKKDFAKISGDFPNKSIKDCVEFYYLWKNICREESQSFKSIISDNSDEIDSDILAI